jgi:hypothetical protein
VKGLKTILTCLLAVLTLIGSTSFVVGVHFCNGQIKELSVFDEAKGCVHKQAERLPACHKHEVAGCCDDTTVVHEGCGFEEQAHQIVFHNNIEVEPATRAVLIAETVPLTQNDTFYPALDDPLLKPDRPVLFRALLV